MQTSILPPDLNGSPLEATAPGKSHGRCILIVEDDEFVREAATETLCSCGYGVLAVCTAAEAKTVFSQRCGEFELLIVDVGIPGQNGLELARELRLACPTLKVLYVSGYSENALARKIDLDCNTRYMAKPFSLQSLLQAVQAILEGLESGPCKLRRASCSQSPA